MSKIDAAISIIKRFIDVEPAKAAHAIEALSPDEGARIIKSLGGGIAGICLENLEPGYSADVLENLTFANASEMLSKLEPHYAAKIITHLTDDAKKKIIELLNKEFLIKVSQIMDYPAGSAGRLMRGNFIAFKKEATVKDVTDKIRRSSKKHLPTTYCYVVDDNGALIGIVGMRDLVLAEINTPISKLMVTNIVKVSPFTDREILVKIFSDKNYLVIPVVDNQGAILGVVNTKDILESAEEEASEDIQILFGASPDERVDSPTGFKIKKRLPWLSFNLFTVFLAAAVVAFYKDLIAKIAALAIFLPVIAGQGGNAGTQTLAVVLRGIIMREITFKKARKVLANELLVSLANGIIIGVITALVAWYWQDSPYLGLVAGIAMVCTMVTAGLAGAFIPLAMKRIGFDPAHSSGIFITTVTDIIGFFSFLGFAYLFQNKII
jgi:magnesium transporter